MSKYSKNVKDYETIDVYDVITLFEVTNPALQHALKKVLMAGKRGSKDFEKDCKEAIESIERAPALEKKPPTPKTETQPEITRVMEAGCIVDILTSSIKTSEHERELCFSGRDKNGWIHHFSPEHTIKAIQNEN